MQAMKMGYEKSGEQLARVTELQGQAKAKEHFNKGACDQRHFPATTLPPTNAILPPTNAILPPTNAILPTNAGRHTTDIPSQSQRVIRMTRRASGFFPKILNPSSSSSSGLAQWEAGHSRHALGAFREAVAAGYSQREHVHVMAMFALTKLNKYAEAVVEAKAALALVPPDNDWSYNGVTRVKLCEMVPNQHPSNPTCARPLLPARLSLMGVERWISRGGLRWFKRAGMLIRGVSGGAQAVNLTKMERKTAELETKKALSS